MPEIGRPPNLHASAISPRLPTRLAALSLRSSPPPPPAPSCLNKRVPQHQRTSIPPSSSALKSLCQEAEDLLPLTMPGSILPSTTISTTSSNNNSVKRRVIFADRVQNETGGGQLSQPSTGRSQEENESGAGSGGGATTPKIKPAIKKTDSCKDSSDPYVNGKKPV